MPESALGGSIFGHEIEYGIAGLYDHPDDADRKIWQALEGGVLSALMKAHWPSELPNLHFFDESRRWLQNGGSVYEDMMHPEYTIPECATVEEAVTYSFGGDEIVYSILAAIKKGGGLQDFKLNRRAVDRYGTVFGTHENYLALRQYVKKINLDTLRPLAAHLATRTVYAGAGAVIERRDGTGADFVLGQKMSGTNVAFNTATHPERPVVNGRDEPQADEKRFVRLHVTSGDPHVSPAAMYLQMGTTGLVIRAMQLGYLDDLKRLSHGQLHATALGVARDLSLREQVVRYQDGTRGRATDVQFDILDGVQHMLDERGSTASDNKVMKRWEDTLSRLNRGERNPRKIPGAGWLHRIDVLGRLLENGPFDASPEEWADQKVGALDMEYDAVKPNSLAERFRKTHWKDDAPTPEQLKASQEEGSPGTRSEARAKFVQAQIPGSYPTWTQLVAPGKKIVEMPDPRQSDYWPAAA